MNHPSDDQLLRNFDGELVSADVRPHLDACTQCQARLRELECAMAEYAGAHRAQWDSTIPPGHDARALLRSRLAEFSAKPTSKRNWRPTAMVAAAFAIAILGSLIYRAETARQQFAVVTLPDMRLTPGATLLVSRPAVCAQANTKNRAVPVALQRRVFEEYGLKGADPRAYEVDYLVTPALGGADDIHNLWPHSYASTIWNAQGKDALEDRLRDMVCDGSLDLGEAQHEIAADWIAAYKKYFHTDQPLAAHWKQRVQ
jgi:hypothetical protein